MLGDPAAGGQLLEQRLVEPAGRAVVDVLDRRLAAQPSGAQSGVEASVPRSAASRSSSSASHSACARLGLLCASSSMKASTMPSRLSARADHGGCGSIGRHLLNGSRWGPDVVVRYRRPVRGRCRPLAIEVVLEDRVDGAVGARPDLERAGASGFETLAATGLDEPQDADASAEALLGVRAPAG